MSTATEEAFQMKGCPTMKIQMTWINAPSYYKLDDCEVHHQNKKKRHLNQLLTFRSTQHGDHKAEY